MNHSFREEDIPILTEVIEESEPHTVAAAASATAELPSPQQAAAMPPWTDADSALLERKLQEQILRQLQSQIDTVLEQQVRDVLADVLQTAVSQLTEDIRNQLQASMERVVAQAVAQEVEKLSRPQP